MNSELKSKSNVFKYTFQDDICIIEMNDPARSVNTLTMPMLEDMFDALPKILATPNLKGVISTSSKPKCYAAGADINLFDTFKTKEDGENASREMHKIFALIANSHVPFVAAINGLCLGGGLELALACHYRVCANSPSVKFGLPEAQLGILPGGGGTQRLPRLIGIAKSLEMILTGKNIDAKKAYKIGLVDDCVPENQLFEKAFALCKSKAGQPPRRLPDSLGFGHLSLNGGKDLQTVALESNPLGKSLIQKQSAKMIQKNTKGFYQAPFKALQAVMDGTSMSLEKGLELEARLFGELVVTETSRSLVHIFHIMTASKKNPFPDDVQKEARRLFLDGLEDGSTSVGVLGAGLMGSGIATVLADKNIRSVMIDQASAGLQKGLQSISTYFDDRFKKKRLKWFERDTKIAHVTPSLNFSSLKNSHIIVEAVFEELTIKEDVLKKCESLISTEKFIFATNTSSIPIERIAAHAKCPEHVIGMHFFSPVPKMPLVEIITHPKTDPRVSSAIFELASRMGKQIIMVNDGPGFYTTRILTFQIAEALNILSEGATIEAIDKALEKFGMPVGPMTLMDEVGIDIGEHLIKILYEAFSDRLMLPKEEMEKLSQDGRKGRKSGKGFYIYKDGKKGDPDPSIYQIFTKPRKEFNLTEIAERCMFVFMNEAARCMDDGVLKDPDHGDFGAIFGLGYPPFLGGPFFYAKRLGHENVKKKLLELSEKYGKRFDPARYWDREN